MLLSIITFQDKDSDVLYKETEPIGKFDKELKKLALDMEETMKKGDGLGLAAPQIGKSRALCIANIDGKNIYFCNPNIVWRSEEIQKEEEGCLSFPGVFLKVPRNAEIEVEYQDIKGKKRKLRAKDISSRTLQHEIDHLKGIPFLERVK